MGKKDDIKNKVSELLATGGYVIKEGGPVPGGDDPRLTFGNTGVLFPAVTLFIDMRESTEALNSHRAQTVAKLHKAYLYIATDLIAANGGHIRSYNGDSVLAFWDGNGRAEVEKAVRCAMNIKFMLDQCAGDFKKYREVDFGVGIDVGYVLCVKVGKARNVNHNDLIWLGNAVNRAVVLSDKARDPKNVWISDEVRNLLNDNSKLSEGKDMWTKGQVTYAGSPEVAWSSTYHWPIP
jgi:adenylate cyclase